MGRCSRGHQLGTTSAYAENTKEYPGTLPRAWNYLRVRGEYNDQRDMDTIEWELPPRTRRIPFRHIRVENMHGTTSAYAENTDLLIWVARSARNYLRVRGEYTRRCFSSVPGRELPPRTRRIRANGHHHKPHRGTTSAYAENTYFSQRVERFWGNYLRVRGEYLSGKPPYQRLRELPPRTRRIHSRGG